MIEKYINYNSKMIFRRDAQKNSIFQDQNGNAPFFQKELIYTCAMLEKTKT